MKTPLRIMSIAIAFGLLSPALVFAGSKCSVDKDGDGDYTSISKAISKGCKDIKASSGTYSDSITLGKGVKLSGKGSKTKISGIVTMKDGSKLEDVSVKTGGIVVSSGDDATISSVTVTGARIGINTKGRGKLKMSNVKLHDNKKGMYIEAGKDVDIRNSQVYKNDEEGIDIRANVDGTISGNAIYSNGESGIEVILGSSELVISGNNIKNNRSSGIATQYYKSAKKLGGLKVLNNKLNGNSSYALNCKTPSGGHPGATYWTDSVSFSGNSVTGNKEGSFASKCKFGAQKEEYALLTEEEKAVKIAQDKKEEEERLAKQKEEQERIAEEAQREAQRIEEEKRIQEEREKKRRELEENLYWVKYGFERSKTEVGIMSDVIEQRSAVKTFFSGTDEEAVANLQKENRLNNERLTKIEKFLTYAEDGEQKEQLTQLAQETESLVIKNRTLIEENNSRMSIQKLFFWKN